MLGASKCPFVERNWNNVAGTSLKTVCGARNRIFCTSASETALLIAPVSMKSSIANSPKAIGRKSNIVLFFNWMFVANGRIFMFGP